MSICEIEFLSKRFKNLLLAKHKKTIDKQKQILYKKLEEWNAFALNKDKNEHQQIDDILVVWFKVI